MSKALLIFVIFAMAFCQGQIQVMVNSRAYFSNLNGGSNNKYCRPSEDSSWGGPTQVTCSSLSLPNPPVSQSRWGNPATNNGQSGLGFDAVNTQLIRVGDDFNLGKLTHFNWPIQNAASGVTLNIIFQIKDQSGNTNIGGDTYNFLMDIDETPNSGTCVYPGGDPCADKITFRDTGNFQKSFQIGDVSYTIRLQGFKENNSSSSRPLDYFISNERFASTAYLFARITTACPQTCAGNAPINVNNTRDCVCDCRTVPCPTGKVSTPNCSCVCPRPDKCLNGGTIKSDCTCQCPACGPNKVLDSSDCSCRCDTAYCGVGTVKNLTANVCECNCPTTACPNPNYVRNNVCNCVCQRTCTAPKVLNSTQCDCQCPSVCGAGFTPNLNNCTCACTKTCPNGQTLDKNACACTNCVGNWTKDTNGLCTVCPLTPSVCGPNERLDNSTCGCVCDRLNCSLFYDGLKPDENKFCACRNCTAGECICGNGRVEPGETCDTGSVKDPCCKNCQWVIAPCNDSNPCTRDDTCGINGTCKGEYKCPQSHDCASITCDPLDPSGQCVTTNYANMTTCDGTTNLCDKRCIQGVCVKSPIVCAADNNPDDCMVPVCVPATGMCTYVPINNGSCNDGNGCTSNDKCVAGVCTGVPRTDCPASTDICKNATCANGACGFVALPNGIPCDADGSACTIGDKCLLGVCSPGSRKVCPASTNPCKVAVCQPENGECVEQNLLDYVNTCDDQNYCTWNDACVNGTCVGEINPNRANETVCGATPTDPTGATVPLAIILSVAGAAALIGAIAGAAFLVKKVRDSKLMDPETWNPDSFSSIGANPLYKGSEKIVDNRLYEGGN